ncbi:hypothetical protein J610_3056 [Acinetobacter sp. 723929]|nr:hypothetical protein J610_3056 [Acinetobacter sp. 723929]
MKGCHLKNLAALLLHLILNSVRFHFKPYLNKTIKLLFYLFL